MNLNSEQNGRESRSEKIWWAGSLAATAVNCAGQVAWFWRFRAHNINSDGIAYIGLARHLMDGNFRASLHGYWSPLLSWMIAGASLLSANFTLIGRLVTMASFLVCLPLVYVLTKTLWRSRVAAALAVLWFSMARGLVEESVGQILADFVLTACVLLYFTFLVRALRDERARSWVAVGAAHAVAFLAKAIAMPWLAISTVVAVVAQNARVPRRLAASLVLAFAIPAAVWTAWGFTLRMKYHRFTTGYQLRANLMTNWNRRLSHHARGDALAFADTSGLYDEYMVGEAPWATIENFALRRPGMLSMLLESERQNIPAAVKETLILLTPGGALALATMLVLLGWRWREYRAEAVLAGIMVLNTISLIVAYCMLVFDGRYVIPIVPVLMAISCPAMLPGRFVPDAPRVAGWLQKTALGLLAASTVFFAVYWASPWRTVDRDFEVSCYQAADMLRSDKAHGTLVSIGDGPYPEHGVGFEAAPYVAYLAGWRFVGGNSELPGMAGADELADKALATKADAVAVWGSPGNAVYSYIVGKIGRSGVRLSTISDPYKGEVGTVVLFGGKE